MIIKIYLISCVLLSFLKINVIYNANLSKIAQLVKHSGRNAHMKANIITSFDCFMFPLSYLNGDYQAIQWYAFVYQVLVER